MLKKLFLALAVMLPMVASAQLGAGQWRMHSSFVGGSAKNCIDAGDRVYYLSSGSLYCMDKATLSNGVLDATNGLSDVNVGQIYYDYSKGLLVVAYNNCNIDIVLPSGEVVNVPAIKDVVLHKAKVINDVNFAEGKIYVATSFGYIVLDDTTFQVKEVRNYDMDVTSVAEVGGYKVMSLGSQFYYCNADEQVEAAWWHKTHANAKGKGRIFPIDNNKFFLSCAATFQIVTIGHGTDSLGVDTLNFTFKQVVAAAPVSVQPYPGGFVASFGAKNYYYTILPDASKATKVAATNSELYTSQEEGNWWVLGSKGLAHVVNGVKGDYMMPNGISITANAYYSNYDPYQQRVLLSRTTDNFVIKNYSAKTEVNSYDGTSWKNITPVNAPNLSGSLNLALSPNEPNTYFYCNRTGSVCKVKDDTVRVTYDANNSPVISRTMLDFDSKGNLWMPQSKLASGVAVLTPENQLLDQVDASNFAMCDMGEHAFPNNSTYFKRQVFCIGAGDTKIYTWGEYDFPIYIWNNNDDLSLNQYRKFDSFNDQDNKNFDPWGWIYFKADNDGMVWMGTVSGVVSMNPANAFDEDFRINRLMYNKFEGIDTEGGLCEGLQVNYIDVDAANNKWIATNASGVFFVSADGREVYKHFDSSNSPLPTDQVYSVCCNRATNSVLIVTSSGVLEYFPGRTPSASDYSDVWVYPSVIEPNFTGLVAINGLMDSSNVVITDGDGNVVKTIVSDGGIALWDACDDAGVRVGTGYYNVYASQGETSTAGEPVAKIAVIK